MSRCLIVSMCFLTAVSVGSAWLAGCASREGAMQDIEQQILKELRSEGVTAPRADASQGDGASLQPADGGRATLPESGPISLADLLAAAEACNPSLAAARSECQRLLA